MSLSTTNSVGLTSLSGILVGSGAASAPPATAVSLAGFDAVVQMSRKLLQSQLEQSLATANLAAPSAYVPWGSIPLPASLLAAIPTPFRLTLNLRPARLELRLVQPYLAEFHWPDPISVNPGGGGATAAVVTGQPPSIDIGWQVEINVLTPNPVATQGTTAQARSAGSSQTSTTGTSSGSGDGGWTRATFATGTVMTNALAELAVPSNLWTFGMELDFSGTSPSVTSDSAAVSDFLATDAGKNMLGQALAPLRAAAGIQLTPEIAPAGELSSAVVRARNLPPFSAQSILLQTSKGDPILCFCVHLGSATGGVTRLVQPFLGAADFAYGVSTSVLAPALKTGWSIAATGVTIVGTVPVDFQQSNSTQTFTGQAQLQITFSNVLNDVSIVASTDNRGDADRLLSSETVQLLNLFDQNGNPQTNLGALAQPQTVPLVIPICMFDSGGEQPSSLQENFKDLLVQLLAIMAFPILNPIQVDSTSISGFASSAMQTFFVRWALPQAIQVVNPGGGGLLA
ncbi:MAG TPA: hypothetical protein VGF08_13545 [Terriglobales bacterium]|jgi:hypothetical protein